MRIRIDQNKTTMGYAVRKITHESGYLSPDRFRLVLHRVGTTEKAGVVIDQDVIWQMIEILQQKFPCAVYWKDKQERIGMKARHEESRIKELTDEHETQL